MAWRRSLGISESRETSLDLIRGRNLRHPFERWEDRGLGAGALCTMSFSGLYPSSGRVSPCLLGLCFSTCTAGKWVCSTSVCPGMSDPTLDSTPFFSHSFWGRETPGSRPAGGVERCKWGVHSVPSASSASLCFFRADLPD